MSSPARSRGNDPGEAARAARAAWRSRQLLDAAATLMEREGFQGVSMQALAEEAEVSVGLIYRYFGGKDELLLAVIVDVLDTISTRVPEAVAAAGDDPVEEVAAAFRAYCEVVDERRHAAVLTYRESRALSSQGRVKIKAMEVASTEPLRAALHRGTAAGLLVDLDADLVAHDLVLMAHGWALKHWYLEQKLDLGEYVAKQTALLLGSLVEPRRKRQYAHLLHPH
ncbi:TetR/AcrR family transcriptional regulator [Saccharopolyspora sp. HNM0983]|uniref:TetR/AcrR family transcriptional regulator n=1 Tax=Saccharopolyspora montiporae TaxID=2781240 RepID=A0A929G1L8_9PSEU|nr:TetR/AcrR family transcriptional regulator [Saccharopolyspora sp. HNM0983]MBE9375982.1 TetR/AcrR family transcriptional regulator [Saccharopolyspora sp. HNM0983]